MGWEGCSSCLAGTPVPVALGGCCGGALYSMLGKSTPTCLVWRGAASLGAAWVRGCSRDMPGMGMWLAEGDRWVGGEVARNWCRGWDVGAIGTIGEPCGLVWEGLVSKVAASGILHSGPSIPIGNIILPLPQLVGDLFGRSKVSGLPAVLLGVVVLRGVPISKYCVFSFSPLSMLPAGKLTVMGRYWVSCTIRSLSPVIAGSTC